MSPKQFDDLFQEVVREEFPSADLAYSEIGPEVSDNLFAGRQDLYLNPAPTEHQRAELEFGAIEVLATVGVTVPVLELAKVAAETYLVVRRHREEKARASLHVSALEQELESSLSQHLGRAKARSVAAAVASRISRLD